VRELIPFVLLVCACGAAVREPPSSPLGVTPPPSQQGASAAETSAASAAAFEALAARGATVAPGMREVARKEGTAVDLVKADARDACVRVAFEAAAPVTAKLLDGAGNALAALDAPATEGVLAARGPVCVRRGDVVRGVADGADAGVRWMAWQAR
jgi:hypothetical protein